MGLQNKMRMFREYFLFFTANNITEEVELTKNARLLAKLQPFFVDVTIIVLMQQIHILEPSNQVLKLCVLKIYNKTYHFHKM